MKNGECALLYVDSEIHYQVYHSLDEATAEVGFQLNLRESSEATSWGAVMRHRLCVTPSSINSEDLDERRPNSNTSTSSKSVWLTTHASINHNPVNLASTRLHWLVAFLRMFVSKTFFAEGCSSAKESHNAPSAWAGNLNQARLGQPLWILWWVYYKLTKIKWSFHGWFFKPNRN